MSESAPTQTPEQAIKEALKVYDESMQRIQTIKHADDPSGLIAQGMTTAAKALFAETMINFARKKKW